MNADEVVLRQATAADWPVVLELWAALFEDDAPASTDSWSVRAASWFARSVNAPDDATVPVIEVAGRIVATAIGTLTIGVPNPWCLRGRAARLENLYTRPGHRGRGFGTRLVLDVVDWANRIDADRVDLSTTPLGRHIYEMVGFVATSAPRMKLVL